MIRITDFRVLVSYRAVIRPRCRVQSLSLAYRLPRTAVEPARDLDGDGDDDDDDDDDAGLGIADSVAPRGADVTEGFGRSEVVAKGIGGVKGRSKSRPCQRVVELVTLVPQSLKLLPQLLQVSDGEGVEYAMC